MKSSESTPRNPGDIRVSGKPGAVHFLGDDTELPTLEYPGIIP